MTYEAFEISSTEGKPVELYTFTLDTQVWYYTSADEAVQVGATVFSLATINRGEIEDSPELSKSGLDVEVPRDHPVASLFREYPPSGIVEILIQRKHRDDAEVVAKYQGRVLGCTWTEASASLRCESVTTSQSRVGVRRRYSANCPHTLYDEDCQLSAVAYRVPGVASTVANNVVSVTAASGYADGYFNGGYIAWTTQHGSIASRTIDTHIGSDLTLSYPAHGLLPGTVVQVHPGCDRTLSECNVKFSNDDNHGGWMFMPTINPFDGSLIF